MHVDNRFYVYGLISPVDNAVFYVGKGTGRRYKRHVASAKYDNKRDTSRNPHLYNKISKIINNGAEIKYEFFDKELTEIEAYALEAAYIEYYGDSLCNIAKGGHGDSSNLIGKKRSEDTKARIKAGVTNNKLAFEVSKEAMAKKAGFNTWEEYRHSLDIRDDINLLNKIIDDERNKIKHRDLLFIKEQKRLDKINAKKQLYRSLQEIINTNGCRTINHASIATGIWYETLRRYINGGLKLYVGEPTELEITYRNRINKERSDNMKCRRNAAKTT